MEKKVQRKRAVLLHINVTEEIAKNLKVIAERQGRTVTELAREAFAKIIKEYEWAVIKDPSSQKEEII